MQLAGQYEELYHATAGFEKLDDSNYTLYMTLLTELAYYQELAGNT